MEPGIFSDRPLLLLGPGLLIVDNLLKLKSSHSVLHLLEARVERVFDFIVNLFFCHGIEADYLDFRNLNSKSF
jgi:hypothetical protein